MTIFFVGPVPPPINGFSAMSQAMLAALAQRTETHLFNRAPAHSALGTLSKIQRIIATLKQLADFARKLGASQHRVLYLGLSGGWGQAFDAAYCLIAKMAGAQVFFHHHSFAYLNQRSALTSLVFTISGQARHIVLCDCMGEQLAERYGLANSQLFTLSNVALMPKLEAGLGQAATRPPGPVVIGFLSNITEDKGIFEFFDALDGLDAQHLTYTATIAGPVDGKIKERFEARLDSFANVTYVGGVYGQQKQGFLSSLDLLLFPTRYANEAEPVTLLEALQCGVSVVAADRGCIIGMVPALCGRVVPITQFTAAVVQTVKAKSEAEPQAAASLRAAIVAASKAQLIVEQKKMAVILEMMCNDR